MVPYLLPTLVPLLSLALPSYGLPSSLSGGLFADVLPRASTCNSAEDRSCWTDGYSIDTDYEVDTPLTGVTRSYYLEVEEFEDWTAPDGTVKDVMLINGTFPGPLLEADWGDRVNITVLNKLSINGTSMHWHGIRQLGTNTEDGVNGIDECPITPNNTRTYSWIASQYGTGWYHSHFNGQYANGVLGPLVINGPASANYDIDLGPFLITDWYKQTGDQIVYNVVVNGGGPPTADNVLFNGTNISPDDPTVGAYAEVTLTPNKVHRLRLVNVGADVEYHFSLVGHNFTIIAADYVPVEPMVVSSVFMGPGMRYDVLIEANAEVGNYWFNATADASGLCGAIGANPYPAAIFRYEGSDSSALPTDPGTAPAATYCCDDVDLSPVVSRTIDTSFFTPGSNNTLAVGITGAGKWTVNDTSIDIDWADPVLSYVFDKNVSGIPQSDNIVPISIVDDWAIFLWEGSGAGFSITHPVHLHGHDFIILGKSNTSYTESNTWTTFTADDLNSLNGNNPMRRDTSILPAYGWAVLAFKTNNPGAWIMHCHIAWHISNGLGVTFLERPDEIPTLDAYDQAQYDGLCSAWNTYAPTAVEKQIDSGL